MSFGEILSIIISLGGLALSYISFQGDNMNLVILGLIIFVVSLISFFIGRKSHSKVNLKQSDKEIINGRDEITVYYPIEFETTPYLKIECYGWRFSYEKIEETPQYFKLKVFKTAGTSMKRSGEPEIKWIAKGKARNSK